MAKQIAGAITNLENLKVWFMEGKFPFWTLYRGNPVTKATNEATVARNPDIDDMEESWTMLEKLLSSFENGVFTVYAKPKYDGNLGNKTLFTTGIVLEDNPGISGVGIKGLSPYIGSIDQILEKEKKTWELERKVEDLETAMIGKQSIGDRIFGLLEANMEPIINNLLPMLLQKLSPQPGTIGGPVKQPISSSENNVEDALARIAVHFDLEDVLPKLATWIEKNPDMARNLLNTI